MSKKRTNYTRAIDRETLFRLYVEDQMSTCDIARRFNLSYSGVHYLMVVYNIPRRAFPEAVSLSCKTKDQSWRHRKHSRERIEKTVTTRMNNDKLLGRVKGVSYGHKGYLYVTIGENAGRRLHDVIMEEHIGRRLKPDECVHHINGVKDDNRLENLQLMTVGEHSTLHNYHNAGSRKLVSPGEESPSAKLTWEIVREIRNNHNVSAKEFALRFNVSRGTIYHIRNNRTWKVIYDPEHNQTD